MLGTVDGLNQTGPGWLNELDSLMFGTVDGLNQTGPGWLNELDSWIT